MTKLIWILIIVVVAFAGYEGVSYWMKVQAEHDNRKKEEVATVVTGDSLPGLPSSLDASLRVAREKGLAAFRAWFSANEKQISDPRKAWIELDLCVAVRRDSPAEARQIFERVKARVPPASPVWPRVKQLENAF